MCEELGVHTKPVKANGDIWIVPLFAWYTPEFDKKWDGEFVYRVSYLPSGQLWGSSSISNNLLPYTTNL